MDALRESLLPRARLERRSAGIYLLAARSTIAETVKRP